MYAKDLIIRCYAEKQGDLWVAVCIDYSLAAQAETLDEVRTKLRAQIHDHLAEAFSNPKYAEQLLTRRAPISHFIKYYFGRLSGFASGLASLIKPTAFRSYTATLPVCPSQA